MRFDAPRQRLLCFLPCMTQCVITITYGHAILLSERKTLSLESKRFARVLRQVQSSWFRQLNRLAW